MLADDFAARALTAADRAGAAFVAAGPFAMGAEFVTATGCATAAEWGAGARTVAAAGSVAATRLGRTAVPTLGGVFRTASLRMYAESMMGRNTASRVSMTSSETPRFRSGPQQGRVRGRHQVGRGGPPRRVDGGGDVLRRHLIEVGEHRVVVHRTPSLEAEVLDDLFVDTLVFHRLATEMTRQLALPWSPNRWKGDSSRSPAG